VCRSCTAELPARAYPEAIERFKEALCDLAFELARQAREGKKP